MIDLKSITATLKKENKVKPILILFIDGKLDENLKHIKNVIQYTYLFHILNLDYLTVHIYALSQSTSSGNYENVIQHSEMNCKIQHVEHGNDYHKLNVDHNADIKQYINPLKCRSIPRSILQLQYLVQQLQDFIILYYFSFKKPV
ncbi:hypothetical protein RIR_jg1120.t1 [Rhizophagus irregularis DAOM 181602=DAOM 197198]|uniref:Uncharacterized protein n=1 Tax=Rhizophagus irregularis (strain DAOM 197198w) TaxID=1432141 RepID=A0A015K020_RHIIW|nr:hypothetical protein RirG_064240 [Rhizophagus irregularis DAOM 197198w]GBC24742.1 hypothetical protein RIR_jg1120.t1 [Rhizophagus irregularis DAOM 181602=DAOM 197198]